MQRNLSKVLLILAVLGGAGLNVPKPAIAAVFEQKEVEQTKYIAIAVPLASGGHRLLILEQISDAKQCWSESGQNPAIVEPLLLNFDFTGICGRGTDSNGYSIRVSGQDLALDYGLRIERRQQELVLIGRPHPGRKGEEMVIGRTGGISSGFMKIVLDPGWRFTRRVFNEKVLGHVYLTQDQGQLSPDIATSPAPVAPPAQPQLFQRPHQPSLAPAPASPTAAAPPRQPQTSSPPRSQPSTLPQSQPIPIPVPVISAPPVPPTVAAPAPSPVPAAPSTSRPAVPPRAQPGSNRVVSGSPNSPTLPPLPVLQPGVVASPNPSPVEVAVSSPSPQPPSTLSPVAASAISQSLRYRILVEASDRNQQEQIKTLVPGAFRSSYQGKTVMQVGAFSEKSKANEMIQRLNSQGFSAILDPL